MAGKVSVHVALLVEAPAAEGAHEGLPTRVGEQVPLDAARVAEHLAADVTFLLAGRQVD